MPSTLLSNRPAPVHQAGRFYAERSQNLIGSEPVTYRGAYVVTDSADAPITVVVNWPKLLEKH